VFDLWQVVVCSLTYGYGEFLMMRLRRAWTILAVGCALVSLGASPAAAVSLSPATSSSANGRVEAAVQAGADLYIGGLFTSVDGAARAHLAALDAGTGMLDPSFNVNVNGEVTSLAVAGSTLYIAGSFTAVGPEARTNVAAIDTSTGQVLPFSPTPSSLVKSIDVANGVAYLGGKFAKVNGKSMPFLAAVDATTGALVPGFNPRPSAIVQKVKAYDGGIYVGGNFQSIGGLARNYVAQLDVNGTVLPWDAGLPYDSAVLDLTLDNGEVYLATGGHLPGGNSAYGVDAASGAQQWQVQTDGNVQAIEIANGVVYAGGHFDYLKPCDATGTCTPTVQRKKLLAIDPITGTVLDWAPRFNSPLGVWDLAAGGGNLYALGDFTTVNGVSHPHIARFALP
jgi:outer membrane protein assembly factor BamB